MRERGWGEGREKRGGTKVDERERERSSVQRSIAVITL